ncbi:LLM class flavin-dependent oxidoreductase [Paenibacillus sp. Marseille-Q4541]|uniref:LLM class flavin-dependent oxidoreductase n=1 Tax=Paenibacillus sp. Marseille-Q4541 TaxID=2831522 RepID=UPI0020199E6F|nr:LLM class flavin-dependent oxidoreductase [Paenibacillus sp. Marseille-Q4541]
MRASVLDQTPLKRKGTPELAFQETIELAKYADNLGLYRYWVSEHHSTDAMGGSSPEVLLGYLAAITNQIRIGSGGVMLPNYSPYKVAENFKVLSALAPGRVDLGVGRATGGTPASTQALQGKRKSEPDTFQDQLKELQEYMSRTLPANHPLRGLMTTPRVSNPPELWMLGTGLSSANIAASMGLQYAFAYFSPGQEEKAAEAIHRYRGEFRSSEVIRNPYALIAHRVIAAATDEEAWAIAGTSIGFTFYLQRGRVLRMESPKVIDEKLLTLQEQEMLDQIKRSHIIGSKETIQNQIYQLREKIHFDEIMALSFIYDLNQRKESLRIFRDAVKELNI